MMARVFRRLRSSGQDVLPCDLRTIEFLQEGVNLIRHLQQFPVERAKETWEAHREYILADWRIERQKSGDVQYVCFGARVFDKTKQILRRGLDDRTLEKIAFIEDRVWEYKHGELTNE